MDEVLSGYYTSINWGSIDLYCTVDDWVTQTHLRWLLSALFWRMLQVEITAIKAGIQSGVFYGSSHDTKTSLSYYGYNHDDLRKIIKKRTTIRCL